MSERCKIKRCRNEVEIYYYGRGVCEKHWLLHCSFEKNFSLKVQFKIRVNRLKQKMKLPPFKKKRKKK